MFNNQMLEILKQVNSITNSIILKYPVTIAVSDQKDMQVYVDFSNIDSDSFQDIGLKDSLSEFLSLFKLFEDDKTVDINNGIISLSDSKAQSNYITDNISLMDTYDIDPVQFDRTEAAPNVSVFELTTDDIKNIKAATGVFKDLDDLIITSRDGVIEISLGATNKFNAKSSTYSISKNVNSTKEYSIVLPIDNFKLIPSSNYEVQIKYNEKRNQYRILMLNKSLEGFKIMLSLKV